MMIEFQIQPPEAQLHQVQRMVYDVLKQERSFHESFISFIQFQVQPPKVQLRLPCLDITAPLSSSKSKPTRARIYSFEEVSTHPCDPAALETPLRHVPYQSKYFQIDRKTTKIHFNINVVIAIEGQFIGRIGIILQVQRMARGRHSSRLVWSGEEPGFLHEPASTRNTIGVDL